MIKTYLNLTNGIEHLRKYKDENYSFLRIQSTICEQKKWDFILQDLDNDFLMNLVIGNTCKVIDYSQKKIIGRVCFQGLEWIKFALYKKWLNKEYIPFVKGYNCYDYFIEQYNKLSKKTHKKLDYFKKFINTNEINLCYECFKTENDGNYEFYRNILKKNLTD